MKRPIIHCAECAEPIKRKPWSFASGAWEHRAGVAPQKHKATPARADLDALYEWKRGADG